MPESGSQSKVAHQLAPIPAHERVGIVLSGGGSRAAYQVGALKALLPYIKSRQAKVSVIVGSSMGALNGIILGGCLRAGLDEAVGELELLWRERTYRNTFAGSPTKAFLRALSVAILNMLPLDLKLQVERFSIQRRSLSALTLLWDGTVV